MEITAIYWSGQVMATVRVTHVCKAHIYAKHAFLGDLGECHHLEIVTLRFHLGSGVLSDKDVDIHLYFDDCSIRVFYCLTVLLEYINHSILINE